MHYLDLHSIVQTHNVFSTQPLTTEPSETSSEHFVLEEWFREGAWRKGVRLFFSKYNLFKSFSKMTYPTFRRWLFKLLKKTHTKTKRNFLVLSFYRIFWMLQDTVGTAVFWTVKLSWWHWQSLFQVRIRSI